MRRPRKDLTGLSSISSTGGKLTHVRDPRATARFSLDEQVGWDEGNKIVKGTIVGFLEDDTMARVRLKDGSVVMWPTFSARMKRVQTGDFNEDRTTADPSPPAHEEEAEEKIITHVSRDSLATLLPHRTIMEYGSRTPNPAADVTSPDLRPLDHAPAADVSMNIHMDEHRGNDVNDGHDWDHAVATMGRALEIHYNQGRQGLIVRRGP